MNASFFRQISKESIFYAKVATYYCAWWLTKPPRANRVWILTNNETRSSHETHGCRDFKHRTTAGSLAWSSTGMSPTSSWFASTALQDMTKTVAILRESQEAYSEVAEETLIKVCEDSLDLTNINIRVLFEGSSQNLPEKIPEAWFVLLLAKGKVDETYLTCTAAETLFISINWRSRDFCLRRRSSSPSIPSRRNVWISQQGSTNCDLHRQSNNMTLLDNYSTRLYYRSKAPLPRPH